MAAEDTSSAKVKEILTTILPEGSDIEKVMEALTAAGLAIEMSAEPKNTLGGTKEELESSVSGAPVEGEPPVPQNSGFAGPPTDDLIRQAFKAATAEYAPPK